MEFGLKLENLAKNTHLIVLPSTLWGWHIDPKYEFIAILHLNPTQPPLGNFSINKGVLLTNEGTYIKATISLNGQIIDIPNTTTTIQSVSDISVILHRLNDIKACFNINNLVECPDCLRYTNENETYCFNCQINEQKYKTNFDVNCLIPEDTNYSSKSSITFYNQNIEINNKYQENEQDKQERTLEKNLFNTCGKTFSSSTNLEEHTLIQCNKKLFYCKTCGKSFGKKYNLNVHFRIHSGEKPYVCSKCGKTFSSKSNFSTHMMSVHCKNKKHKCDICHMNFIYPRVLKIHKRIHTGEKPFMCQICGKVFSKNIHLTVHTRTHTGEKPHLCNVCGKGFTTSGNLKSHIKINHKDAIT